MMARFETLVVGGVSILRSGHQAETADVARDRVAEFPFAGGSRSLDTDRTGVELVLQAVTRELDEPDVVQTAPHRDSECHVGVAKVVAALPPEKHPRRRSRSIRRRRLRFLRLRPW